MHVETCSDKSLQEDCCVWFAINTQVGCIIHFEHLYIYIYYWPQKWNLEEQWAIMDFLVAYGENATDISWQLKDICGDSWFAGNTVQKWILEYKNICRLSHSSGEKNLINELHLKVCSKQVPWVLRVEKKAEWLQSHDSDLTSFNCEGHNFLKHKTTIRAVEQWGFITTKEILDVTPQCRGSVSFSGIQKV